MKRLTSVFLTVLILISVCLPVGYAAETEYQIFSLGKYEQNGRLSDGPETMEWIILDTQGTKLLFLSRYAIDIRPFNESGEACTWETSSIRAWLNGEFLETVIPSELSGAICLTELENERYSKGADCGKPTEDKVFLLSEYEADHYFATNSQRRAFPTDMCAAEIEEYGCWWMLRTMGSSSKNVMGVHGAGGLNYNGRSVDEPRAVRPAMWVDIGEIADMEKTQQCSEYVDFCWGDDWYAALKADGTVVTSDLSGSFSPEESEEVSRWKDVVDIESNWHCLVALKSDGTVEEIGPDLSESSEEWHSVNNWSGIISIHVSERNIIGLKSDGTVCIAGSMTYQYTCDIKNVLSWENVVQLELGNCSDGPSLIALCADGTVLDGWYSGELDSERAEYAKEYGWPINVNNAVSIDSSGWTNLCVKSDGTVETWGIDILDTSQWTDIIQACAGDTVVFGLKKDGTVVYTDSLMYVEKYYGATKNWRDIVYLCHTNDGYTFGVRKDGTVLVNYRDAYELEPDDRDYPSYIKLKETIESWIDVESIEVRYGAVVGHLRSGSVVVYAPAYKELIG